MGQMENITTEGYFTDRAGAGAPGPATDGRPPDKPSGGGGPEEASKSMMEPPGEKLTAITKGLDLFSPSALWCLARASGENRWEGTGRHCWQSWPQGMEQGKRMDMAALRKNQQR